MRKELLVNIETELRLTDIIGKLLLVNGYNSSNSVIVTVSTDYSSIIGQILRHQLSYNGEICEGFGVDVPYPDQNWDDKFVNDFLFTFAMNSDIITDKNIILVEAGVIRGGNYTKSVDLIKTNLKRKEPIVTVAMFENIHSKFKSDFVGEYYDNETQDLTFWWERENNHWK